MGQNVIFKSVSMLCLGLLLSGGAAAQSIKELFITTNGSFELMVQVSEDAAVVLNDRGEVLDFLTRGRSNMGGFNNSDFDGRPQNIDGIQFSYNREGRLERLGNVSFSYFDSLIDADWIKGKLRRVGNANISYFDSIIDSDYMKGKVKRVGSLSISYYDSIIDEKYIQGKIKRIGSVNFKYFDSMFDEKHLLGKLKSGQMAFTAAGIQVRVRSAR